MGTTLFSLEDLLQHMQGIMAAKGFIQVPPPTLFAKAAYRMARQHAILTVLLNDATLLDGARSSSSSSLVLEAALQCNVQASHANYFRRWKKAALERLGMLAYPSMDNWKYYFKHAGPGFNPQVLGQTFKAEGNIAFFDTVLYVRINSRMVAPEKAAEVVAAGLEYAAGRALAEIGMRVAAEALRTRHAEPKS